MTENTHGNRSRVPAILGLSAAICLAGCTPNVTERDLSPATLADLSKAATRTEQIDRPQSTVIIDARTPSAFRKGHIPGASNLSIADINPDARRRTDLAAAERIIVYGQNPGDTLATGLALRLLESGYGKTRLFRGGVDEWTQSGGTLVTESP